MSGDASADWLDDVLPKHERLTAVAATMLESALLAAGVEFLSVSSRTKDRKSALEKIERKGYTTPQKQFTDLSGVRIIVFLNGDVVRAGDIIRNYFDVIEKDSLDKASILGSDKVGYRSVHYVCHLGSGRVSLPEYREICDLAFEIQVRTVLQHAWAELTHDRSYKFRGTLPAQIERQMNLHAGLLEIADIAFENISQEIDHYVERVKAAPAEEAAREELNSITLTRFMDEATRSLPGLTITDSEKENDRYKIALEELNRFGIHHVGDLQAVFNENLDKWKKHATPRILETTSLGFIRTVLLLSDAKKFVSIKPKFAVLPRFVHEFLLSKYTSDELQKILALGPIQMGTDPVRRRQRVKPAGVTPKLETTAKRPSPRKIPKRRTEGD